MSAAQSESYASLCSGIGGLDLAVEQVFGLHAAWQAEVDPEASKVLARHWPGVPNLGDITNVDWAEVPPVELICAGFPCQDISYAGAGAGIAEGTRSGLWFEVARAVRVVRPRMVVVENVAALLTRGLDRVTADLAALGYVGSWVCLRASDVGAPHRRERVFLLATDAERLSGAGRGEARDVAGPARAGESEGDQRKWHGDASDDRRATAPHTDRRRFQVGSEPDRRPDQLSVTASRRPDADRRSPTPADTPSEYEERRAVSSRGRRGGPEPLSRAGGERPTGRDWGTYEPAIRRWERVLGRAAPEPVDSRARLSPHFVEWMMGYPAGWVDGLKRTAALKALGNAVVPQQGAAALSVVLESAEVAA